MLLTFLPPYPGFYGASLNISGPRIDARVSVVGNGVEPTVRGCSTTPALVSFGESVLYGETGERMLAIRNLAPTQTVMRLSATNNVEPCANRTTADFCFDAEAEAAIPIAGGAEAVVAIRHIADGRIRGVPLEGALTVDCDDAVSAVRMSALQQFSRLTCDDDGVSFDDVPVGECRARRWTCSTTAHEERVEWNLEYTSRRSFRVESSSTTLTMGTLLEIDVSFCPGSPGPHSNALLLGSSVTDVITRVLYLPLAGTAVP